MEENQLEKAVKDWRQQFSRIPSIVFKKLYGNTREKMILLSSEKPILGWPACAGTLYSPNNRDDQVWIKDHICEVEEYGFMVYSCEEFEILLAFDDICLYHNNQWEMLYNARFSGKNQQPVSAGGQQ